MRKQLPEELQSKIKEWASANAATEATTFDETRYVGIIDGAWWMAEQLVEAQERIKELEKSLNEIQSVLREEEDLSGFRDFLSNQCDKALLPNNKLK